MLLTTVCGNLCLNQCIRGYAQCVNGQPLNLNVSSILTFTDASTDQDLHSQSGFTNARAGVALRQFIWAEVSTNDFLNRSRSGMGVLKPGPSYSQNTDQFLDTLPATR
jgi:hypothetical protein